MTNQNTQAQTAHIQEVFKHRCDLSEISQILEVNDSINQMSRKAKNILILLTKQFETDKNESTIKNETIIETIFAVIDEITDIQNVINAHWDAVKGANQ